MDGSIFTAGHWVPEMIELAGRENLISKRGEHSRRLMLEEIKNVNPEFIIIMPCGFDVFRTKSEYHNVLHNNYEWNKLEAVKNKNVFL